jgi:predicted CXXCH cytochrome family protein
MSLFQRCGIAVCAVMASLAGAWTAADDSACLECHGSAQQVRDAAGAMDLKLDEARVAKLAVTAHAKGTVHQDVACLDCHPKASEMPHPTGMLNDNPCATCHEDELNAVNKSVHRDPKGAGDLGAKCWACHGSHDVRPVKDPASNMSPSHVASRCLQCHDKREYLLGQHGQAVELAGLDMAATCVSCHGGHDILAPSQKGSRVTRRNISFTCGKCHGRVAERYRASVHGAALMDKDNPDVPTCVDCHAAHKTQDPRSTRFRLDSPQLCAHCHANPTMMGKYGLSTAVFDTYVADFHGTTAELFRATSPDQPMNKAVCYDCHGFHDVESTRAMGDEQIKARLLVKCQACHPNATPKFLTAWTGHYVPSPDRYPLIYYTKMFYKLIIPGTVGFFLTYIAVDVYGRRRQRRKS